MTETDANKDLRMRLVNVNDDAKNSKRASVKSLRIAPVFSDRMVLQRNRPIRIDGTAIPSEKVELEFAGQRLNTRSDRNGKWSLVLKPMAASSIPRKMTVRSGKSKIEINDILVGDVWMASGQSNMVISAGGKIGEYKSRPNFYKEKAAVLKAKMLKIAEWNEPEIRFCSLAGNRWNKCVGKTAMGCSLVGMFFARKLHRELNIPIGMINTAAGCASIETFMPPETLEQGGFHELAKEGREYQELLKKGGPAKLEPAERQKILRDHCLNPRYFFCRNFVQKDGTIDPKNYNVIQWHMTVVKPCAFFLNRVVKFLDFPVRGIIWYQGETNVPGKDYDVKQKLLTEAMRELMKKPDLPFFAVMIAPIHTTPNFWAQQYAAVTGSHDTALVNTADTPPDEQADCHPSTKDFVGERLALAALNLTYGKKNIVYSGPVFDRIERSGSGLLVSFRHAEGLRTLDGKSPLGFEIAGGNKVFVPAKAVIENGRIRLSSPKVTDPKFVRYAWARSNRGLNVVNGAALPMFPFDSSHPFFASGKHKGMHKE